MLRRKFEQLDITSSVFGIGCMRLPLNDSTNSKDIDEEKAIELIRYGIDKGVTYIDTAYPYHGKESERVVGKALKDGYRDRVLLATKLPPWEVNKKEDMERLLDEQLKKLDVEIIDFYLLHALNKSTFEKLKSFEYQTFLDKMVEKGKIRYPSFSFHDDISVFKDIIDDYPFKMAQIQLNILDTKHQAGIEGLKYASDRGVNVVVMEPLRGGRLVNNVPDDINKMWGAMESNLSIAGNLFGWLTSLEGVKVILSGVSTLEQLKDNIETFEKLDKCELSSKDIESIEKIATAYREKDKIGCTNCKYCMPCPQGINIPGIFANEYNSIAFGVDGKEAYKKSFIDKETDASRCVECGLCEKACPQGIKIIENLKRIDQEMR